VTDVAPEDFDEAVTRARELQQQLPRDEALLVAIMLCFRKLEGVLLGTGEACDTLFDIKERTPR
jgi:hypothetical protein